jgi:hypothetical protein
MIVVKTFEKSASFIFEIIILLIRLVSYIALKPVLQQRNFTQKLRLTSDSLRNQNDFRLEKYEFYFDNKLAALSC